MLESLFHEVYKLYKDKNSVTFKMIDSSLVATDIKAESQKMYPKMTTMNKALKIPEVWEAVLTELKVGPNCKNCVFPDFAKSYVYGVVSEGVHNADIASVILSDKSTPEYQIFFRCFGNLFGLPYKEFIEEMTESVLEEYIV